MSSHHMVKEGQEPALIIANGQMCSYALLEQMLQWSPLVVVCDGAYERTQRLQLKADVVIGDFDSLPEYTEDPDTRYIKLDICFYRKSKRKMGNIVWFWIYQ